MASSLRQPIGGGNNNPLNGWFIGIYGQSGLYDLERSFKGQQGEFYSAGISAGYVFKLGDSFHLELSLGAGYAHVNYRKYEARSGGRLLIWDNVHRVFHWTGPTKAEVSLVWYPHFKKSRKNVGYEK